MKLLALTTAVGVLALTAPVRPSSRAYLVGFVQDTQCHPLPGVKVSVKRSAAAVVTDAQGRFTIAVRGSSPRTEMTARLAGFRVLTRTGVRLRPPSRDAHTLTLDVANLAIVDRVIVTPGQTPGIAATDTSLSGEVLTTACTPIDGATLSIHVNGHAVQAMSDAAGRFAFRAVPAGSYRLRVRAPGFVPLVRSVTKAGPNAASSIRLILERGDNGESDYLSDK